MSDLKFVCSEHGAFEPGMVYYSCPAQAACPVCGKLVESNGGVKVLTEEEARAKRPGLWAQIDWKEHE